MQITIHPHICLLSFALTFLGYFGLWGQSMTPDELMGRSSIALYGTEYQLRKEAHDAFLQMRAAAALEGIAIKVVSSYRSYAHQNRIWERKYKKYTTQGLAPETAIQKITEYSTIPGTSRHHWGTDLDLVDGHPAQPEDVLLAQHFRENGPFCKFKEWMDVHAQDFGFYLVYTDAKDRKGFKYEPWHYSYAPLSIPLLKMFQEINLKSILQQQKLLGSDHFSSAFVADYIAQNILDINPALLP